MTGSLCHFILSFFLFVGSHFWLLSIAVRARLLAVFELKHFLALYSIILIILFARVLLAYGDAIEVMVWDPLLGFKHVSLTLMLFACLSIVRGHTTQNPAALKTSRKFFDYSPKGICKITRHPILWSGSFWGISHVFASGELAKLILFGGPTVLALGGAWHIDFRHCQELGDTWRSYEDKTSFFPW